MEHCARHKGSLLGAMPGVEQPSQKNFETQIATALEGFDLSRPVYVEGESARIGRLSCPCPWCNACAPAPAWKSGRLRSAWPTLLRDYATTGDDPEALAQRLEALTELHGKEVVQRWQT